MRMIPDLPPSLPAGSDRVFDLSALTTEDPALAFLIRTILWDRYCQADCPLGASEEAMCLWWEYESTGQIN